MANQTHKEMAALYRKAIVQIVSGTVSSYSVLGQSFTKHDLKSLEDLCEYHERKYSTSLVGSRAVADLSDWR